jgi:hypothetical protein
MQLRSSKRARTVDPEAESDRVSIATARRLSGKFTGCIDNWTPEHRQQWKQIQQMYEETQDRYMARAMFARLRGRIALHADRDHVDIDSRGMTIGAFLKLVDTLNAAGFDYQVGNERVGGFFFVPGCKTHKDGLDAEHKWCIHFAKTSGTASS